MNIIESPNELRRHLGALPQGGKTALVPTMGSLHPGHMKLVETAKKMSDSVVLSIYVNPTQFGPDEDYANYPRSFEQDASLCRKAGVDVLFAPENLYSEDGLMVSLHVGDLSDCLCGKSRPTHFDGVATIVCILFNLVEPDMAIFGEKDYQQLLIIKRMVADLHLPVEIIGVPTAREEDGLAISSRNRYLNKNNRITSRSLYNCIKEMDKSIRRGENNVSALVKHGLHSLSSRNIEVEYLEIRHTETLKEIDSLDNNPARAFIAARIGGTRLIDNILLEQP